MAGFRELEGREIGSPPMSSGWSTACSRNTGMFCRMKGPKPSRVAVCRCSGPRFPSRRSEFAAPGSCATVLDAELWLEHDDGETVVLPAGDFVVQQATRHGWRNKARGPPPSPSSRSAPVAKHLVQSTTPKDQPKPNAQWQDGMSAAGTSLQAPAH